MRLLSAMTATAVTVASSLFATVAFADGPIGRNCRCAARRPPGGMAVADPSVICGRRRSCFLDNLLLWIIVPITIFVDRR